MLAVAEGTLTKNNMNLLQQAAKCFTRARQNLIEGAAHLYAIEAARLWEGKYGSFSDYVEQECQISRSFAAKLIAVHGYYIEKSRLEPLQLVSTDMEKLYLAISLQGTAEEQALRAQTWSRGELQEELRVQKHGEHDHEFTNETFKRCGICGRLQRI